MEVVAMTAWLHSWSRGTWAMAVGLALAVVVVLVLLFGADVIAGWVSAIWNRGARP